MPRTLNESTSDAPPSGVVELEFGAKLSFWFDTEQIDYEENQCPEEIKFWDKDGNEIFSIQIPDNVITLGRTMTLHH